MRAISASWRRPTASAGQNSWARLLAGLTQNGSHSRGALHWNSATNPKMRINPTQNDECGVQVSGTREPPFFGMPFTPARYADTYPALGLAPAKDASGRDARPGKQKKTGRGARPGNKQTNKPTASKPSSAE